MKHSKAISATYALALILPLLAGCPTSPSDGGNNGGGDNGDDADTLALALESNGEFTLSGAGQQTATMTVDAATRLPDDTPTGATLRLDAADITFSGSNGEAAAFAVHLAAADSTDPCGAPEAASFSLTAGDPINISPANGVAADSNGLALLSSGAFSLCLVADGPADTTLDINRLYVDWTLPQPITAESCAEIVALDAVQNAIAALADADVAFVVPTGDAAPDLTGAWSLSQTVSFDPDDANTGDELTGEVTLSGQTAEAILRSGFGGEVSFYIESDGTDIGLCTLARTRDDACDQTIARLEVLSADTDVENVAGEFLSVVVRRHGGTSDSCGAEGDFIYGDLSMTRIEQGPTLRRRGKSVLPDGFTPGLLAASPNGGFAAVGQADGGLTLHVSVAEPFGYTPVDYPDGLEPEGVSALGFTRDGDRLAVLTDLPDATLIYDNTTFDVVRANDQTSDDYIGGRVDFSIDASRVFVPTIIDEGDTRGQVQVQRSDDSTFADIDWRLTPPEGAIPVQVRLSPDGTQLAVLLEGEAEIGLAQEIAFMQPDEQATRSAIDLVEGGGGTVLATELVYSPDGAYVFVAGLGAVLAVQTESPYDVTRIDVSNGAGDDPVDLVASPDGEVLCVAVDDAEGDVNFAVIDMETLQVVNQQRLEGIAQRDILGLGHFGSARVVVAAGFDGSIVAVQSESPYEAGRTLSAADDAALNTLGAIEGGGDAVVVTNADEAAVYIYELEAASE